MLSHHQIWAGIDLLAARYGLSASGLARKAGLDPTSFNRSKRMGTDGRERWPSTESIAKILDATGAELNEFIHFVAQSGFNPAENPHHRKSAPISKSDPISKPTIPLIGFAQAGSGGFFDAGGMPNGIGWDEVVFPDFDRSDVFAFEINGDSMQPLYRDGDIIIVSPSARLRRGDRVVVKTKDGEVMAKELRRQTPKTIELLSLNPHYEDRVLAPQDITWMARVMWASQ
jgi:phage repressor protein C with HTH and peptisase S24 domain